MSKSIRKNSYTVHRNVGNAIEGDQILIECRKPAKNWQSVRGSDNHNYFSTVIRKNAYAVLTKTFTNVKASTNSE